MANILVFVVSVFFLLVTIKESEAGRCFRVPNAKKSAKISGDGGHRLFIDGEPMLYQPGKIYNGKFN